MSPDLRQPSAAAVAGRPSLRPPAPAPAPARRGLVLAAVLCLLLAAASCGKPAGGARGGMQMPPMPVEIAAVTRETVSDGFTALGTVDAEENVEIVSEIPGTVRALPFVEGQPVAAGALLVALDDREERAEEERAAALVEQVRLAAERTHKLYEQQLTPAEERERADANLKVAEANYALAKARHEKTEIRAPFAGVVGWRRVSPGAYVQAGAVITNLTQTDRLRIAFAVPERFAGTLKRGAKVTLTTAAFPGETFTGAVDVVDPQVDPTTRSFGLIARLANPGGRLKPGMSAAVTATLVERRGALVVPDEAVVSQGGQNMVYVLQPDSTVQAVPVQLGLRSSARVEVTGGLAAGDQVVKAGHQKIFPGAKVMPVPEGGTAGPPAGPAPGGKAPAARPEGKAPAAQPGSGK
jgi:membrane fusion protein (multidrug efflux system)